MNASRQKVKSLKLKRKNQNLTIKLPNNQA